MPDGESDHLLLSDDERLHALNVLSSHYAAGRLDTAEFYDRSGTVSAARTLGEVTAPFAALPGGVPLRVDNGMVHKVGTDLVGTSDAAPQPAPIASPSPDSELASLVRRGRRVESLDVVIVGVTLVSFLILQFLVDWDYAWIVWPSLVLTLGLPRLLMEFSSEDEELYEEIKGSEKDARAKRLREAAKRINELERGRDD